MKNHELKAHIKLEHIELELVKREAFFQIIYIVVYESDMGTIMEQKFDDKLSNDYKLISKTLPNWEMTFDDFKMRYYRLVEEDLGIEDEYMRDDFLKVIIAGPNLFSDDWKFDIETVSDDLNKIFRKYDIELKIEKIDYLENYWGEIKGKLGNNDFFLRYFDLTFIFYILNKILSDRGLIIAIFDTGADYHEFTVFTKEYFKKVQAISKTVFLDPMSFMKESELYEESDIKEFESYFKVSNNSP